MDTLKAKGVEKVVCVSVAEPEELQQATSGLLADKASSCC
jgi:peroxiredoxin